jgi:hypothetical protein
MIKSAKRSALRWHIAGRDPEEEVHMGPGADARAARLRIAELPPRIGKILGRRHAPFRVLRWLAWSPNTVSCPRHRRVELRYKATMRFRRWSSHAEFGALDATAPSGSISSPDAVLRPKTGAPVEVRQVDARQVLEREAARMGIPAGEARVLIDAVLGSGVQLRFYEIVRRDADEGPR